MPKPPASFDPEKLKDYAKLVFGALGGAMTSAMIYLGDRLGLYRALAGAGAASPARSSRASTGLSERWLREWLYQQGAAGVLAHRGERPLRALARGRARCSPTRTIRPSAPASSRSCPHMIGVVERLPEAFRTGVGLPYDALGPEGARGIERGFAPWFRALLVPIALPRVAGRGRARCARGAARRRRRLRRRRRAARDGEGVPELASSTATTSRSTRSRAPRRTAREAGVSNARFHDAARDPLPERRELRLRHHLRLPARHDRPGAA